MSKLLTRDEFREGVFARDRHTCVSCGQRGQDAHHVIERRLFPDGGYYLDNGVTLCGPCHITAEQTVLTCDVLRARAGIQTIVLPPHFYPDTSYDKWGNILLPNNRRLPGELFDDESVQKVLAPILHLFDHRVKYPRTWHLPWSAGVTDDDRVLDAATLIEWIDTDVVITEKMDGENTTLYRDYIHARSVDYSAHVTRNWMRNFHAQFAHEIPDGMRICGENLSFKHSIGYDRLPSYFMVFSIWQGMRCLSWTEMLEWCELLNLVTVPVIYQGRWTNSLCVPKHILDDAHEGYVVRPAASFNLREFSTRVGKYVRKNHVTTHGHWMRSRFESNNLERAKP